MYIFIGIAINTMGNAIVLEKYTNSVLHISIEDIMSNIDTYYGIDRDTGHIVKLTNEIIDSSPPVTSSSQVRLLVGFDAQQNIAVVSRVIECEADLTETYEESLGKRKIVNIGDLAKMKQSASERVDFVNKIEEEYSKYISTMRLMGISREFDYVIIDDQCVLIDYKGNNDTFIIPEFITVISTNSLLNVHKIIANKNVKFISKKCSFGILGRKEIEIIRTSDNTELV